MRRFLAAILITWSLFASGGVVLAADEPKGVAPAPTNSFANSIFEAVDKTAEKSKAYETGGAGGLAAIMTTVIKTIIGFLGVASVGLFIYAGFLWMTAGGNDDQISKAKTIMKQVVIGFIVLSLAYGIVSYVFYIITVAGGTAAQ